MKREYNFMDETTENNWNKCKKQKSAKSVLQTKIESGAD